MDHLLVNWPLVLSVVIAIVLQISYFHGLMSYHTLDAPQFFLTAPAACPYIEGEVERKVFTHLVGELAPQLNDVLSEGGFRRSQNIAYRPACENCRACISVRVLVDDFMPTRSMKRIEKRNADLIGTPIDPIATSEQYALFRKYINARHYDGGMAEMSMLDYLMMVQDTHIDTLLIEYRKRGPDSAFTGKGEGPPIAYALTDRLRSGLSMVYSFFDPEENRRSIGSYLILEHIRRARKEGLPHLYLGYWVEQSAKMAYKARFLPQERVTPNGWERFGRQ